MEPASRARYRCVTRMARYAALRASDADRDAVSERLRTAAVEGRLDPDELDQRLHIALRARTYGELEQLVDDLPVAPGPWSRHPRWRARSATGLAVRVLGLVVVAAVVVAVMVLAAAWWIFWVAVWFAMCGRRRRLVPPPRRRATRRPPSRYIWTA
jgi:hypothetical protein